MSRKPLYSHDYLLFEFKYENVSDLRKVLKNYLRLQALAERGVSNATSILADITKAVECNVDGFERLTEKQWGSIYYHFICDMTLRECAIMLDCSPNAVQLRARSGMKKLLHVLGDDTNGNSKGNRGNGQRMVEKGEEPRVSRSVKCSDNL